MSAPSLCWMPMENSGVNRCELPSMWLRKVTPSSSTNALRSLPGARMSSFCRPVTSMARVLRKPTPRLMTWNPPESVNVGPFQFSNRVRPPAASTMSGPGCRYRWYAFDSTACAPVSRICSGVSVFTVAFVPTGMNAGVCTSPCGVRMIPARPGSPSICLTTLKLPWSAVESVTGWVSWKCGGPAGLSGRAWVVGRGPGPARPRPGRGSGGVEVQGVEVSRPRPFRRSRAGPTGRGDGAGGHGPPRA